MISPIMGFADGTVPGQDRLMLVLRGSPSFSPARLQKRLARISAHNPGVRASPLISCTWWIKGASSARASRTC